MTNEKTIATLVNDSVCAGELYMDEQAVIEQDIRDDLIGYISDEYKSVHGIRPRWMNFSDMSLAELREEADRIEQMVIEDIRKDELKAQREEEEAIRFCAEWQIDRVTYDRWMDDHDKYHKVGEYWWT
jgi:hypothetical protein